MKQNAHTDILRSQRGFSLVELIVVMVILAVGILPLAYVQTRAQQEVLDSGRDTEALAVANLVMENARARGFGNVVNANGASGNYTWTQTVTTVSFGLQQVVVDVTWFERTVPRRVTVTSRISMR
ncbi:MAG TPA: prepilin-type N-terminal cleavage/methylation domain-containing protein [Candidatus Krumholzibacteria bacterium]|nr:prepilin-type N-terminal cleavage/methylation domain-containing protein [Candidatus Krumholzibacteria bacterium]